jgi:3-keto-disaccharide hydrolase
VFKSNVLLFSCCAAFAITASAAEKTPIANPDADREDWIALFNSRDLTGWTPKITGYPFGENYGNTYRVEEGLIKVRYDQYPEFGKRFGILTYKDPFSYYRLIVEYRFVGEQVKGGPGSWALRNSGAMLHSQDPRTMELAQDFPISVEAQFLGGLSDGKSRPTLSMCSPGTEVAFEGKIYPEHCLTSNSKTYDGDQWVRVEMIVLGSGHITHIVNGEKVLEYSLPQIGDPGPPASAYARQHNGELIEGGYISLQSESHPIDFRKVELLNLEGCMDRSASNYKIYYVKSKPGSCKYASTR